MSVTDIPNFEQLTDLERLELAEELLASIRDRDLRPPPVAHRLELERRWSEYGADQSSGLSEEQFWTAIPRGDPEKLIQLLKQRLQSE